MSELPSGWELLPLQDRVFFQEGPGLRKWQFGESGIPFLNIRTFKNGTIDKTKCQFVKLEEFTGKYEHFLLEEGDIVVSSSGTLGKLVVVRAEDLPLMLNTSVIRYRSLYPQYLLQSFLKFFLQSHHFFTQIDSSKTGSAILNYGPSHLKEMKIIVPPVNEQWRIAAKLEKLLSRVEAAQARLATIPRILKRFRQSVLAAACSGRLTADWRKQNPDIGSQAALLYESRELISIADTPDLPGQWFWTSIEAFMSSQRRGMKTGPFGSMLKKEEHQPDGVPVLGIENIAFMQFKKGSKIHITKEKARELSEYKVLAGDVLISRSGTVGEVCVVPDDIGEARISTNLMRVVLSHDIMLPMFFCYLFNGSPFVLDQVSDLCKGSTREFLNQAILKSIIFPQPPLSEQQEIVCRVEALFKTADALEARYRTAKAHVDKLTQSILARAFRGELVPQDPNDEPASALIERIKNKNAEDISLKIIRPKRRRDAVSS